MFFSGIHIQDLYKKANHWLVNLGVWLRSNGLELNVDKTKYIIFRPKGIQIPTNLTLNFNNKSILQSETICFLGVTFHENLSWTPHITSLRKNLCRAVGALNRLRYYLPTCVKRQVYYALFHSRLNYCSLVWSTTTQTNLNNLTMLRKRAIRAITNLRYSASCAAYFKKT